MATCTPGKFVTIILMFNMTTLHVGWLGLAAALLAGCSGFNDDFSQAAALPVGPGQIEGAWVGTWRSDTSDHSGELKAIVTRVGRDAYNVRYRAVWSKWLPAFKMETALTGHFAGSTFHFEGDADLGWPYGRYEYAGYSTGEEFFSTYQTEGDRGVYSLHRTTVRVAPTSERQQQADEFGARAVEALNPPASELAPAPPAPQPPADEPD